ncbi:hypothetical protein PMI04_000140 [Sphingobium sp. AP49]|uniref:hypothetical protein n=1 Tax=Sphingobium sp. AP49 TaxID=1144307 RepID=UPI00026ED8C5|nr:hypothetical protein [Sphingobium sp. AP49]WHO39048.1 hypothetical protein PMI04_000140 [Sphingobium sp. AP49]
MRWSMAWKSLSASGVITGILLGVLGDGIIVRATAGALAGGAVLGALLLPGIRRLSILKGSPLEATFVSSDGEVRNVWLLGKTRYQAQGKHYPDERVLLKWAETYRHGITQASDKNGRILGYLSVWPVTESCFEAIRSGALLEDDITDEHIALAQDRPHSFWYIADIFRGERVRGIHGSVLEYVINFLVASFFANHSKTGALPNDGSIEMIAFAATSQGKNLLKAFGFGLAQGSTKATGSLPVYYLCLSTKGRNSALQAALNNMIKLRRKVSILD